MLNNLEREIIKDPLQVAKSAGLRYISDTKPSIRRKKIGKNFSYIGTDGKPIRDSHQLQRIRSIGVPPAYTDVWICPTPKGHIQATGRDAKGRKQYRYHPRWREVRDETKYSRMLDFGKALPRMREWGSFMLIEELEQEQKKLSPESRHDLSPAEATIMQFLEQRAA